MKALQAFLLFCALPALAAPPELPTYDPVKKPLVHTAGSKKGALERMAAMRAALKQALGWQWRWTYTFGPPEKTTFRFYGRSSLNGPETLLGTNSAPVWTQWFTNGSMQYVICVAADADMARTSDGRVK